MVESSLDYDTECLLKCLQNALGDEVLAQDIYEACQLNSISFSTLARGELSTKDAAEMLFLTEEEALLLYEVCANEMRARETGVPAPDVPRPAPKPVHTPVEQEASVEAPPEVEVEAQPEILQLPEESTPSEDMGAMEELPEPVQEPVFMDDDVKGVEQHDVLVDIVSNPEAEEVKTAVQITAEDEELPAPVLERSESPKADAATILAAVDAADASPSPASPSSAKKLTPNSSKSKLSSSSSKSSSTSMKSPSVRKSAQSTDDGPSYLRTTAAQAARTSKNDEQLAEEMAMSTHKPKKSNVFSRVATFLQPTLAALNRARTSFKKEEPINLGSSQQLAEVLNRPQGQRITSPKPFALLTEQRPKTNQSLTTEELAFLKATEAGSFKARPLPKFVKEARPLEPRVVSKPTPPEEICKPFKLASAERHEKIQARLNAKREAMTRKEEDARLFKARSLNKKILEQAVTPPRPETPAPTKPCAPALASDKRAKHYYEVIQPHKLAKYAEAHPDEIEEKRKQKELEEMPITEFRKSLQFKARRLPDFGQPFRPASSPRSPTLPKEFRLSTDQRLGSSSARSKDGGNLSGHRGYRSVDLTMDPFLASLRSSGGVSSKSLGGASSRSPTSKTPSSLRKSLMFETSSPTGMSAAASAKSVALATQ